MHSRLSLIDALPLAALSLQQQRTNPPAGSLQWTHQRLDAEIERLMGSASLSVAERELDEVRQEFESRG